MILKDQFKEELNERNDVCCFTLSFFLLLQVGILAFSHKIQTPSGCFGTTVAAGIPANLAKLKKWVRKLRALGRKRISIFLCVRVRDNPMMEGIYILLLWV